MAVLTLPESVGERRLLSWSPYINVVLFVGQRNLILCRCGGQQVWSAAVRRGHEPLRVSWCPTGQRLAVVYEDGVYQIVSVVTGRAETTVSDADASCVAWSHTWTPTGPEEVDAYGEDNIWPWASFSRVEGPAMAVGTRHGSLEVALFGVLSVGEVDLFQSNAAVSHVLMDGQNYAVIIGNILATLSVDTTHDLYRLSVRSARAAALVDELETAVRRYESDLSDIRKLTVSFSLPKHALYELALTGYADSATAQWMEQQHEAGFKRWYKVMSGAHDSMRRNLLEVLIPTAQQLLIFVGDLGDDADIAATCQLDHVLMERLFRALDALQSGSETFESFATWLEQAFSSDIDRAIGVTRKGTADVWVALEYLDNSDQGHLVGLSDVVSELRQAFDAAIDETRRSLRSHISITSSITLPPGEIRDVCLHGTSYAVLYADKLVIDTETVNIQGVDPIFGPECVISLSTEGGNDGSALIITEIHGKLIRRIPIPDFEPEAMTVQPGTGAVCVLSKDAHHYLVIDINA